MNIPGRYRPAYDRLAQPTGLALVACGVSAFLIPGVLWWMIAAGFCLVAVRMVQSEWLDISVRPVTPGNMLLISASVLFGFAAGFAGAYRDGLPQWMFDWRGILLIGKIAVQMLVCTGFFLAYRWRRQRRIRFLQSSAPAEDAVDRISVLGGVFHLAGYIVGFAMAAVAMSFVPDWFDRVLVFLTAFLAGKFAVDFLAPAYAPISSARTSQVLLRMAAISPLWWGLPWSFVLGLGWTLLANENANEVLYYLPDVILQSMLPCFLVVTGCFFAVAVSGFLFDVTGGPGRADALPGGALDQADWVRLFLGVLVLTCVAVGVVYETAQRFGADLYGEERWTCAKMKDEYAVGWVARAGVQITVHDNHVYLFDASCVPKADGNGCAYDDAGWEEFVFEFHQRQGSKTLGYTRGQEDVKPQGRHHGDLVVGAAAELITEMLRSRDFTLTINAAKKRRLYSVKADLSRFAREYGVCTAHWRESAAERQARR